MAPTPTPTATQPSPTEAADPKATENAQLCVLIATMAAQLTAVAPTSTSTPTSTPVPGPFEAQLTAQAKAALSAPTDTPAPAAPVLAPPAANPVIATPVVMAPALNPYEQAHQDRLRHLEDTYIVRDINGVPSVGSLESWMRAVGFTWSQVRYDARQVEEETLVDGKRVVSGMQVTVSDLSARWSSCLTTDNFVDKRLNPNMRYFQSDLNNPSVIYTEVDRFDGTATMFGDCQNWGQLWPGAQQLVVQPAAPPAPSCLTLTELDQKYGIDRSAMGATNGLLYDSGAVAGAVLKLNSAQIAELSALGWTIQGSNPTVKSAWSPAQCRPLQ